jgi:hypothetical protein
LNSEPEQLSDRLEEAIGRSDWNDCQNIGEEINWLMFYDENWLKKSQQKHPEQYHFGGMHDGPMG